MDVLLNGLAAATEAGLFGNGEVDDFGGTPKPLGGVSFVALGATPKGCFGRVAVDAVLLLLEDMEPYCGHDSHGRPIRFSRTNLS